MLGATAAAVTLKVAAELVTLLAAPLTTTRNRAPLSASVVAAVVRLAETAPATSANVAPPSLLRCHW